MKQLVFPRPSGAVAVLFSCALVAACARSTSGTTGGSGGVGGGMATGGGAGATTTTAMGGSGAGGGLIGGGTTGGAPPDVPPIFYVHTNTTLYQGDPSKPDLAITLVGDVECIGGAGQDTSLTDLAVSATGELWGISKTNVYKLEIAGAVVKCTQTIPLQNPAAIRFYGLTFAPKGVIDPDKEVLIAGNTAGELWQVDASGVLTQRGTLGTVPVNDGNGHTYPNAGKKWELSGDLVFLDNGGMPAGFATVRDCPNPPSSQSCDPIDTLVELNVPKLKTATTESVVKSLRGQIVKSPGCPDADAGYGSVFGITAWKDKVYGFSRASNTVGYALTINNDTGTACVIKSFDQPWSGAGITTIAPVDIPPAK
jgi:hypothetical protein